MPDGGAIIGRSHSIALKRADMKKIFFGIVVGAIIAFPLGINFGKDVPLWTNPFAAKPDIPDRVIERTGKTIQDAKNVIHDATKPIREKQR
jgi:hypothetical protein